MKQPNTKLLHIFQMVGTAKTEVQRPKQVELNIAAQSSKAKQGYSQLLCKQHRMFRLYNVPTKSKAKI